MQPVVLQNAIKDNIIMNQISLESWLQEKEILVFRNAKEFERSKNSTFQVEKCRIFKNS
jgi:hypothetical protein